MTESVTFFPNWRSNPYLDELAKALRGEGWRCAFVGRKGLMAALISAIAGRGTVHLHWFEGFTPGGKLAGGLIAWIYLPLIWLAGRRGRVLWTVHNVVPHEGYGPLVGPFFLNLLARSCSRLLVHFEIHRVETARRFGLPNKVFVTPPASYGHLHGSPVSRTDARAALWPSLAEEIRLFIQFGNLRSYRDPTPTILAFREAASPSARLFVAGACEDSSIKARVMEAAEGDPRIVVRFGRLSDKELVNALCAADWAVFPYVAIQYPSAVNLAVAYDCRIIAPALPAIAQLAAGHQALLYPTDGALKQRLSDAIVVAESTTRAMPSASKLQEHIGWKDQARMTASHYLAARGRAGYSSAPPT